MVNLLFYPTDEGPRGDDQPSPVRCQSVGTPRVKSTSLPRGHSYELSPVVQKRGRASPNTLSPIPQRRARSPSPSPKGSPITMAKNLFRHSGSHLRELSPSPHSSPLFGRKKFRGSPKSLSRNGSMESEFLYWWMDSTGDEVNHWQQMLEREGEWVYFWHTLRPKLKAAYSWTVWCTPTYN